MGRTDIDNIALTLKCYTDLVERIEQVPVANNCREKVSHLHSSV